MSALMFFQADGKTHSAVVAEPQIRRENAMTREYEGAEYQIAISLSGGFIAHPIVEQDEESA